MEGVGEEKGIGGSDESVGEVGSLTFNVEPCLGHFGCGPLGAPFCFGVRWGAGCGV